MNARPEVLARVASMLGMDDPKRPKNWALEQVLLGCLLSNNRIFHTVSPIVSADDFDERHHGALFQLIGDTIASGNPASFVTLKPSVAEWPKVNDLTYSQYLTRLVERADFDGDVAGYARSIRFLADRRRGILALQAASRRLYEESTHADPGLILDDLQGDLDMLRDSGAAGQTRVVNIGHAIDDAIAATMQAYEAGGGLVGLSTGICALDAQMGGMGDGDLIYLAARTGMGKTALAGSIAFNLLRKKVPLAYISLEMPGRQLAWRYLAQVTGISVGDQRRGKIDEQQTRRLLEAKGALLPDVASGFKIVDRGCTTAAKITNIARVLHRKNKIKLLIIDYLGLAEGEQHHTSTKATEVSEISRGLKQLAMQLGIPVLCLLQVNRKVEERTGDKRLTINDLKDSGSLEQDADMVLLLHRDDYDIKRDEPSDYDLAAHAQWEQEMAAAAGRAEVNVAKHRHDAPGRVNIAWDAAVMRYRDLDEVRS